MDRLNTVGIIKITKNRELVQWSECQIILNFWEVFEQRVENATPKSECWRIRESSRKSESFVKNKENVCMAVNAGLSHYRWRGNWEQQKCYSTEGHWEFHERERVKYEEVLKKMII